MEANNADKEQTNPLEVIRVCETCGEVNKLNSNNVTKMDAYTETGDYYRVIFFECCRCGKRIGLQIDNHYTLSIYKKYQELFFKTMKKKIKHETISPKDVRKKDKLTKQLRKERALLEEKTSGLKLFDKDKNILFESLTFSEVYDTI